MRLRQTALALAIGATLAGLCRAEGVVTGELKKWHKVTVTFDGPETSEAAAPNPFRDYRLTVTFSNGSKRYVVPGFFAADGNAAESSATAGNRWRVHFAPDEVGTWTYRASFRTGPDVAVHLDPGAGRPAAFDGASGRFDVGPSDKTGRDHRATGRLDYVGEHYRRFAESGRYFLKGGADSPENFLGYADFDGDRPGHAGPGGPRQGEAPLAALHRYEPHVRDWRAGDPTWKDGRGKGIVGALNYLAGKGMNSVYFLTMNVEGDGRDVWPWTAQDERFRFDCSKLDQWEVVFSHMDRLGIMLHVVTQEQENDQLLDEGELGIERKLYYRELVARFAHHLAITWNLGEENTNTDAQRKAFSKYLHDLDPYDHAVVCHTFPGKYDEVYEPLLAWPWFEGVSLQTNQTRAQTIRWLDRSAAAGRKWIVTLDEIGPSHTGVKPDADDYWHDEVRQRHLWANLMAGGAGVEWYFGYKYAHNDLNCEDWRSRDHLWDLTRHALEFFADHLPFHRMARADGLTSHPGAYCLARPGEVYAVYLPEGDTTAIDLGRMTAPFDVRWFNPRTGGSLQTGSIASIAGPGKKGIGNPPGEGDKDWVALIEARGEVKPTSRLTVRCGLAGGDYPAGAAVPITAVPPSLEQVFDRWTGPADLIADPQQAETLLIVPDRDIEVTAAFKEAPPVGNVASLTLINAETNQPIAGFDPIRNHAEIHLDKLPTRKLNVRADVAGENVARVRFGLDGNGNYRTEGAAPFALAGDTNGDYNAIALEPGTHTISATPYPQPNATGRPGRTLTVTVRVIAD